MPTTLINNQNEELKDIVVKYLQGEAIRIVKIRLAEVSESSGKNGNDLYKAMPIDRSCTNDKFLTAILGSLNIKPTGNDSGEYERLIHKSKNFHELLLNLYHDGHHHVGYLLQLVDNTKPPRNWATIFILGTLLSGSLGIFGYFKKEYIDTALAWATETFPTVISWLGRTFSMLRNIPLLGIIYNSLGLLAYWYTTFRNGTTTTQYKLENLLFRTLTAGLVIAAYCLTYLAEGLLTVPAATLFVLGSSIDVIKGIYNYFQTSNALLSLPPREHEQNWEELAELERAKNLSYRSLSSVWIKLAAAVLTTAAVVVWNFSPPNLIITVTSMAVISLISLTKRTLLAGIHESYAHRLQKSIRDGVMSDKSPELTPQCAQASTMLKDRENSLEQLRLQLEQKKQELDKRETVLGSREKDIVILAKGVTDTLEAIAKGQELSSSAQTLRLLTPQKAIMAVPINDEDETLEQLGVAPEDGLHARSLSASLFLRTNVTGSGSLPVQRQLFIDNEGEEENESTTHAPPRPTFGSSTGYGTV